MKLTIDRNALMRALSHVQAVVERRNTIPILSNILLQAEGDRLSLTATDLDIEATDAAEAKVKKAGSITAPAQTLFDVVRKLPEGSEISLDLSDGRLAISAGRSRFALPTLPASDFQTMAREPAPTKFEIEAAELRRLIDKTRFAISTEETRYYLNGIYLHHAKGRRPPRGCN
jgi:DNA polymerase-3 subunit beta